MFVGVGSLYGEWEVSGSKPLVRGVGCVWTGGTGVGSGLGPWGGERKYLRLGAGV